MKKWKMVHEFKIQSEKFKINELIDLLLNNRGITTKKENEAFPTELHYLLSHRHHNHQKQ